MFHQCRQTKVKPFSCFFTVFLVTSNILFLYVDPHFHYFILTEKKKPLYLYVNILEENYFSFCVFEIAFIALQWNVHLHVCNVCMILGGYAEMKIQVCYSAYVEIRTKLVCSGSAHPCCMMWLYWNFGSEHKIHALARHRAFMSTTLPQT